MTNIDSFPQQENNEVQTEIPTVLNNLLDEDENYDTAALQEKANLSLYTALIMMPDNKLNKKKISFKQQ